MTNREQFIVKVDSEIKQAGNQRLQQSTLHNVILVLNILAGATTTYLAATGFDNKSLLAFLAAFTTLAGTSEKTFSFGRKASGFRKAKTEFEKLRNDLMRLKDDQIPDSYVDRLNEIKDLKVQLTSKN